jgi:hypothetical protein
MLASQGRPATTQDPTYRLLLGEAAWGRLAPAIRERFSVKPAPDRAIRYTGTMSVRRSFAGWFFAQAARLFGRPIVGGIGEGVPVQVSLRLHADGGVIWTRRYYFAEAHVAVASSIKRFNQRDGLIEYSTRGLGMHLRVTEQDGGLHFQSLGHFLQLGRMRIPIPDLLTPGMLQVEHRDEGCRRFRFRLTVRHSFWGVTFFQDGIFGPQEHES